jgi:hypothetical protein
MDAQRGYGERKASSVRRLARTRCGSRTGGRCRWVISNTARATTAGLARSKFVAVTLLDADAQPMGKTLGTDSGRRPFGTRCGTTRCARWRYGLSLIEWIALRQTHDDHGERVTAIFWGQVSAVRPLSAPRVGAVLCPISGEAPTAAGLRQHTFAEERDRRAGPDANAQKKGRLSRALGRTREGAGRWQR